MKHSQPPEYLYLLIALGVWFISGTICEKIWQSNSDQGLPQHTRRLH